MYSSAEPAHPHGAIALGAQRSALTFAPSFTGDANCGKAGSSPLAITVAASHEPAVHTRSKEVIACPHGERLEPSELSDHIVERSSESSIHHEG